MGIFVRLLTTCMALLTLVSCQTALEPSGFLGKDDAKLGENKELPFSRSWKNPRANLSTYSRIAVRPMKTGDLRPLGSVTGKNFRNTGDTVQRDAEQLAAQATEIFKKELGQSPNRRVTVSARSSRSSELMYLETNLVQVEPGRPSAEVAGFVVPFFSLLNRPSIGIEGRLVDAATGTTLFAFSDLERSEISLVDVQKFSYYGVQVREIERWAKQLRKVVEGNANSLVRDSFIVQPLNW